MVFIPIACDNGEDYLQPDWVVKIKGNENIARKIADENGFEYIGKIEHLDETYHFKEKKHTKRIKRSAEVKTKILNDNNEVFWIQQQKTLIRSKRNLIIPNHKERSKRLKKNENIKEMFNDPQWMKQWYLHDSRQSNNNYKRDLHVIPVWNMNITGKGIKVTIVDDGIEYTHPELKDNYDPESSFDFNDNDNDPMPSLDFGNNHGTHCASQISMKANNGICGVGIAYNAKIGGIRMLDGNVTDLIEALSLGFNNSHVDIYSASWGPEDMGKVMQRPGPLLRETFKQGATKGRHGKGNIYVWAGGNGGYQNDSCACDGYASSIYTICVNSINPDFTEPFYTERCSSIMASTFSSNGYAKLIVADVNGQCSDNHSGTSAAAPYAAGIIALTLEANPNLTWRDIKHLIAWTSQVSALQKTKGWKLNRAGFWVSDVFGFGQMDAKNIVIHAQSWVTVPEMTSCTITKDIKASISNMASIITQFDGDKCYSKIKFIENIVISMTFQYSERGALYIAFISPNGMHTTLLSLRYSDKSSDRMIDWPFNTVHNWGEDPRGLWTISVEDKKDNIKRSGTVEYISVTFYGTNTIPNHIRTSPHGKRLYDSNYNRLKNNKRNSDNL